MLDLKTIHTFKIQLHQLESINNSYQNKIISSFFQPYSDLQYVLALYDLTKGEKFLPEVKKNVNNASVRNFRNSSKQMFVFEFKT